MRLLVISDLHGDHHFIDLLNDEFVQADLVICAGDFAQFKAPQTAIPMLKVLIEKHDSIVAVTGNCDEPELINSLEEFDISVQKTVLFRDGLLFAGSGGALHFTGETPNERSEEEIISDLDILKTGADEIQDFSNVILVIHQPPKNTKLDQTAQGIHVGSDKVRTFIEEKQPLAVISGHIHESISTDTLGRTFLLNPGSLAEGKYAVLTIEKNAENQWNIATCNLHTIP